MFQTAPKLGKHVLVVEDEPLQRMMMTDMLEEAGYEVTEAADGLEAIAMLEKHQDICVVFSDIDMPHGDSGLALAASVRRRWPPVKVILVSGALAVDRHALPRGVLFFNKPFRPDEIVTALHGLAGVNPR